MYLSPSKILYTNCVENLGDIETDSNILEVSRRIQNGGSYPTLQVVKKCGYYFTLNDTQLKLYRYLEKTGQCEYVYVQMIANKEVPEGIRNLMKIPESYSKEKTRCVQKEVYTSVESNDSECTCSLITNKRRHDVSYDDDEDDEEDDEDRRNARKGKFHFDKCTCSKHDEDDSDWSDDDYSYSSSDDENQSSDDEDGENEEGDENKSFI